MSASTSQGQRPAPGPRSWLRPAPARTGTAGTSTSKSSVDSGLSRQTRRSEAPRQAVASAIAWPGAAWLRTRSDGRGPRFGAHTPGGGESAGGRSEGCGREKRSRTSRDGLDETPDKTQRQKHRGQTDRSLRLAARRPRRSDKGQAKTAGASCKKRDSQQRKWMHAASKHGERCLPREQ